MGKTPEYTKRAIDNYKKSKDLFSLTLTKGTKERIKSKYGENISFNSYFQQLVDADLKADTIQPATGPEDINFID